MKIGAIEMPPGAALAPMAGVTDCVFRPLCFEQGAAWAVSEMVSAKGFLHMNRNDRVVRELLMISPGDGIIGLQLFGHEPELMAEAAYQLQVAGFRFIDINMGCPAHKIVSNGDGSSLMKNPELCGQIVERVVKRVNIPVTVKLRAGWDAGFVNCVDVAQIAEQAGASGITVHGRTRDQLYSGQADWRHIADVKRAVGIPVIGNGDVRSGADALRMITETGCDAVAVGRGALGNPWIFAEILSAINGEHYERPALSERVKMAIRHMDEMVPLRGERSTLLEMRKHVAWYIHGERGAAQLRSRLNQLGELDEMRHRLIEIGGL